MTKVRMTVDLELESPEMMQGTKMQGTKLPRLLADELLKAKITHINSEWTISKARVRASGVVNPPKVMPEPPYRGRSGSDVVAPTAVES